jgi:hypothetical protein
MVPFADDTSIIVTGMNKLDFGTNLNPTFRDIDSWFNANLPTFNFNKFQYVEFQSTNYCSITSRLFTIK